MPIDDLLQRFATAVTTADSEGFAALFTPEGSYDDGFFGLHRGRTEIAAMLQRFHVGGEQFRWQFIEPLANDRLAYAGYCFSYRSKEPQSAGRLIVFEGQSRLRLQGGLIAAYTEVFDRGLAFVQLGYERLHINKLLERYAREQAQSERVRAHLAWREQTP